MPTLAKGLVAVLAAIGAIYLVIAVYMNTIGPSCEGYQSSPVHSPSQQFTAYTFQMNCKNPAENRTEVFVESHANGVRAVAFKITDASPAVRLDWVSDSRLSVHFPRAHTYQEFTLDGFPRIELRPE